jgi:clan AA aspartic protease (TIGR02281 family)
MEVPIAPGRIIRLPVRVHGPAAVHELEAVLDTGAAFLTIATVYAEILGYDLEAAPQVTVTTASGEAPARRITLDKVAIGELTELHVPALCLNLPGGTSSLLGMNFLGRFRIVLDPRKRLLSITRP